MGLAERSPSGDGADLPLPLDRSGPGSPSRAKNLVARGERPQGCRHGAHSSAPSRESGRSRSPTAAISYRQRARMLRSLRSLLEPKTVPMARGTLSVRWSLAVASPIRPTPPLRRKWRVGELFSSAARLHRCSPFLRARHAARDPRGPSARDPARLRREELKPCPEQCTEKCHEPSASPSSQLSRSVY